MRKEIRRPLKTKRKNLEILIGLKDTLADIVPQIDWDAKLELEIILIDEHLMMKTRAGKNKSLQMTLIPLFKSFARLQIGQSRQVNIVYDLFVEFNFDDYARDDYHTADQLLGEKEKKERIRKQFQQPAMKFL